MSRRRKSRKRERPAETAPETPALDPFAEPALVALTAHSVGLAQMAEGQKIVLRINLGQWVELPSAAALQIGQELIDTAMRVHMLEPAKCPGVRPFRN